RIWLPQKPGGSLHRHAAPRLLFLLLFVLLARAHGLLAPLVSLRQIGLASVVVAALKVCLTTIGQVQVLHRVVIVWVQLDGLQQVLHSFVHLRGVGLLQLLAGSLALLHVAIAVVGQTVGRKNGDRAFV